MTAATVPVLPLVTLHLHLWEIITSVNQGIALVIQQPSGTLTTRCGTHRGVQVGVLVVIVADHGSLLH